MLSQLIDKIDNFIIVHCTAQCAVPPEARLSVDSSAQLPAKREGEEKLFSKTIFYPTLPSPQKETAELCPGCDCLVEDTTDYRLVLTGQEIVVQICKDCNKQPNE